MVFETFVIKQCIFKCYEYTTQCIFIPTNTVVRLFTFALFSVIMHALCTQNADQPYPQECFVFSVHSIVAFVSICRANDDNADTSTTVLAVETHQGERFLNSSSHFFLPLSTGL